MKQLWNKNQEKEMLYSLLTFCYKKNNNNCTLFIIIFKKIYESKNGSICVILYYP